MGVQWSRCVRMKTKGIVLRNLRKVSMAGECMCTQVDKCEMSTGAPLETHQVAAQVYRGVEPVGTGTHCTGWLQLTRCKDYPAFPYRQGSPVQQLGQRAILPRSISPGRLRAFGGAIAGVCLRRRMLVSATDRCSPPSTAGSARRRSGWALGSPLLSS